MFAGQPVAGVSRLTFKLPNFVSVGLLGFFCAFLPACAQKQDGLDYRTRQQAATIQSLNQEIQRLNDEIRQMLTAQRSLQQENADLRQKSGQTV